MGAIMQLAYRAQKVFWTLFRPHTRGVKAMVFNSAGEILLIRNGYGATNLYVLPGGGVRPCEEPEMAARRELNEELGCFVNPLMPVSTHYSSAEGKRDKVHLFEARLDGTLRADDVEVIEAAFFALDALPEMLSPATARRLAERSGLVEADGSW